MQKKLLFGLTFLSLTMSLSFAGAYGPCTKWSKSESMSCVFNSRSSTLWVRQCTHLWDLEAICMDKDPNGLKDACTEWVKESSVQCYNGDSYEQSWLRSCAVANYKTQFCSEENPNNL